MYRIGELAKLADVTPDTIRYYEKQQMMDHEVRTEGGFRLYTENDLQRLKFIRYARQLGFTLDSIRELLSIRIDPEHHTCQESKVLCKSDCRRLKPGLRNCKRCSVRYKGLMMLVAERPTVASIVPFWKPWNRGPVERNQDVDLLNRRGYTRAVNLYNRETL
ncbi:zinc-responsive transcriptional regulator [Salmonella enterica subsp. enterica serovar Virchow str. ATCC 51955]|nr:zinc-responsive transcriptional regulator [Salmonella enterica subsp. enterica serovar Virchow str. ATCC 51955]